MDNIYSGFKFVKGLSLNNPYGTHRDDIMNGGKSNILQIEILKKPKNFSERLEFKIKTDLSARETVQFSIMDSESILSTKPDKDDTVLESNTSLKLGSAKYFLQFTEKMQKKAFEDTEFSVAECYIKIYHPKVGTVYSEVFNVDEFTFSKSVAIPISTQECKKELVSKISLSANDRKKFISTVLCESQLGNEKLREIAWVYHNRVRLHGVDTHDGLRASNPFRKKLSDYKLCSCYFKIEGEYSNYVNEKYGNFTIKQYLETSDFKKRVLPKFKKMEIYIDKEILIDKPQTCFKDWEGQGFWGDLDLNPNDPLNKIHDPKWFMARQYYWLQIQKKVSINYIHIMRAGTGTTFIFHEKKIAEYFKKNPNTLPQPENVRKFRSEEGILDFD